MCIGDGRPYSINIAVAARTPSMHGCMPQRNVDIVNMQHPLLWENTSTIITQRRIEVCPQKVVNNTENEKYNAFFYLTDILPHADRSNHSDFSVICHDRNTCRKRDNRGHCFLIQEPLTDTARFRRMLMLQVEAKQITLKDF